MAIVELTYQVEFCFNWTKVIQKPSFQVDFQDVPTGSTTENELIILINL